MAKKKYRKAIRKPQPVNPRPQREISTAPTCLKPFSLLFFQRGPKGIIYCRIKVYGRSLEWSTFIPCKPGQLNSATATIAGHPVNSARLQKLRNDLLATQARLELAGVPLTPQLIRDKTLDLKKTLAPDLAELFQMRLQEEWERHQAGKITRALPLRYTNYWELIQDYYQWKTRSRRPALASIQPTHAQGLAHYLTTQRGLTEETARKIIQYFKTTLERAFQERWIERNPFALYKQQRTKHQIIYLTEDETRRLADLRITDSTLSLVRDYFLWACYTGLNFKDLSQLRRRNIETTRDGGRYIQEARSKNGQIYTVPLYAEPLALLDRYADHEAVIRTDSLFPVISHDKTNQALKIIRQIAGIEKPVTWSIARRTAATYLLNTGVPIKTVAAILGNSVRVIEMYYAVLHPETVLNEVNHATQNRRAQ